MFDVTFFAPKTFPSEIFTKNYINTVVSIWKKKRGDLGASKNKTAKSTTPKQPPYTPSVSNHSPMAPLRLQPLCSPRASAVLQLWGDVKTCQLKTPRVWDFVGLTTKF